MQLLHGAVGTIIVVVGIVVELVEGGTVEVLDIDVVDIVVGILVLVAMGGCWPATLISQS